MKRKSVIIILSLLAISTLCSCTSINSMEKVESHGLATSSQSDNEKNEAAELAQAAKTQKKAITQFRSIIRPGDKGDDVQIIQSKLKKFGYNLTLDGQYGDETYYAVLDFQHNNKLDPDGYVSAQTLKALLKDPTPESMYKPKLEPIANNEVAVYKAEAENAVNGDDMQTYTNYFIMVDLDQHRVYIFNGSNRNWTLVNTFACSSGAYSTPTVRGHFDLGGKGEAFVTPNQVVCKYFSQISGNYLFHSILYDKDGNVVDSTLGSGVSHGCIRLALENAKYIYDNIPSGTGIWIR
ncbi:MAG: L,D-transpeptidase family protein [Bacillota bacterium]|nr:L,D-transpeptidase family protein [Bacillota bacterium]